MYFTYKAPKDKSPNLVVVVWRDNNGVDWTLGEGEKDAGYLAWVAEGNEAQPWE